MCKELYNSSFAGSWLSVLRSMQCNGDLVFCLIACKMTLALAIGVVNAKFRKYLAAPQMRLCANPYKALSSRENNKAPGLYRGLGTS
jgi:hypothetical protein